MSPRDDDDVVASDGLPARKNGIWARDKLSFIDEFGPPALTATRRKSERHYVDLFAGPGLNVDPDEGREYEGAALRALRLEADRPPLVSFTHASLLNLDEGHHDALERRTRRILDAGESRTPAENVRVRRGNAHTIGPRLLRDIDRFAYVFLFLDPEKPEQLPWRVVDALRREGPQSLDAYILFPLDMAINRLISYRQEMTERNARALTSFFGTDGWRDPEALPRTNALTPELRRALTELYLRQLRTRWKHAVVVREVHRRGGQRMYKMILASDHEAALRLASWARGKEEQRDQLGFGF